MARAPVWHLLHGLVLLSFIHMLKDFIQLFPASLEEDAFPPHPHLPSIWLGLIKWGFLAFPSRSQDRWRNHAELLCSHKKLCRTWGWSLSNEQQVFHLEYFFAEIPRDESDQPSQAKYQQSGWADFISLALSKSYLIFCVNIQQICFLETVLYILTQNRAL